MKAQLLASGALQVELDAGETLSVGDGARAYTLVGPTTIAQHPQPGLALEAALAAAGVTVLPVQPDVPDRCSRLGLKRALSETGPLAVFPTPEWPAVKALIDADAELAEDWELAVELVRADPLVQGLIAQRKYTSAQVDQILLRAVALVS